MQKSTFLFVKADYKLEIDTRQKSRAHVKQDDRNLYTDNVHVTEGYKINILF